LSPSGSKSVAESPETQDGLIRSGSPVTSTSSGWAKPPERSGLAANLNHVSPGGKRPVLAPDSLFLAGEESPSLGAIGVTNHAINTNVPTSSSPTNQLAGGGVVPLEVVLPVVQSGEGLTIPASLANPSAETALEPINEQGVEQLADEFAQRLAAEGASPENPEYLQAWENEAWLSDLQFKARYGQQAWMQRHMQAHHQNRADQGGEP
jgi:hypothetical protein